MSHEDLLGAGMLTIQEAAALLRLSRAKVYTMMDAGELAFAKFGRARRIPRSIVNELIANRLQGGAPRSTR